MNPQPFKFKSWDDFFESLTKDEKKMVRELHGLILNCIPEIKMKLSYNVPFYSFNRRICFIWPASVPWGKVKMHGVQLGFCSGYLLNDPENFLDRGSRKQVFSKTYFTLSEIQNDLEMLRHFLFEAAEEDKLSG